MKMDDDLEEGFRLYATEYFSPRQVYLETDDLVRDVSPRDYLSRTLDKLGMRPFD